jgi:3-oxoacyl-[acyl-carrier protein] reductase
MMIDSAVWLHGEWNMGKLAGKTAVVTGASKGIGAGIAKAFAAEGAAVVVNYASSKAGAEKVVAEIKAKGGHAIAVQGDVAKAADVKRIFDETKKTFGRLDVLVNNAGVYNLLPLEALTEAEFHRHFDTNVLGLLLATQEATKHFADGGSIINIGSAITELNPPNAVIYTATKGAVDAATRVLSKELGPRKIRVNSINPGVVETEGTNAAGFIGGDLEKQFVSMTPLGRTGQPDDIGPVAVFLASDDSRWVTGDTIVVSGGLR